MEHENLVLSNVNHHERLGKLTFQALTLRQSVITLFNARRFYLSTRGILGRLRCQWVEYQVFMSQ